MMKRFKCPACKKIIERDVGRNVVRRESWCRTNGRFVTMRRVKP
jgi:hypothetical protein